MNVTKDQKISVKKVVLAYSGGLDTSAIIPWLKENFDCEVVAFAGDVGQGSKELDGIEEKALRSGASRCVVADLKDEFAEHYIAPVLKTGAVYENGYLLGTAMARPLLARAQVALARETGADALAHGCTGKGNDQVRFETAYAALAPDLKVIAPWRQWSLRSRHDLLAWLANRDIPCEASAKKIYSRDANLWHTSHEGGELEDPACAPGGGVWTMTCAAAEAPDTPLQICLQFTRGQLTGINNRSVRFCEGLCELNHIAATHGVGRADIIENRLAGMKSRGCYETPGGTLIIAALRALETLVLDRDTLALRRYAGEQFARLLYDGKWFSPAAQILLKTAKEIATKTTGDVNLRLYKGQATVEGLYSPESLYSRSFATFDEDDVFSHRDAGGFIRLFSLDSRIRAMQERSGTKAAGPDPDTAVQESGAKANGTEMTGTEHLKQSHPVPASLPCVDASVERAAMTAQQKPVQTEDVQL